MWFCTPPRSWNRASCPDKESFFVREEETHTISSGMGSPTFFEDICMHMFVFILFHPPTLYSFNNLQIFSPPPQPAPHTHTIPPDSQFPPITTEEQRTHYKKVFGEDYEVYSSLKDHIETVSPECAALSKKLDSLPKHSEEAKVSELNRGARP